LQAISRRLAGPAIGHDVKDHLLAFVQAVKARALDGADVNENIRPAIVRLNEAEALLGIEPLHGSVMHGSYLCKNEKNNRAFGAGSAPAGTASIDEKEEVVGQGETRFRRGKFIRPKLDF
jgi:hypothetical protein